MQFIKAKALIFALVIFSLLACTPLQQRWNPNDYTVQSGDTLYSIAWRYEKDFRDLARWNNIKPPYAIFPGQRLKMLPDSAAGTTDHEEKQPLLIESDTGKRLDETSIVAAKPPKTAKPAAAPESITVKKGDTLYSIARRYNLPVHKVSRWNALKRSHALYPGQVLRLTPPSTAKQRITTKNIKVAKAKAETKKKNTLPTKVSRWYWPTRGKLIKTFKRSNTDRKGIGIAGNRGQLVKATAAGQVVYSGNGLISYGNLVIIKHSNTFLSAYAYNQKLLVKEGDRVKAGQSIAHMGVTGHGKAMLHFEIRRNGKPVNPLKYLP